jgi:hypothetical protein
MFLGTSVCSQKTTRLNTPEDQIYSQLTVRFLRRLDWNSVFVRRSSNPKRNTKHGAALRFTHFLLLVIKCGGLLRTPSEGTGVLWYHYPSTSNSSSCVRRTHCQQMLSGLYNEWRWANSQLSGPNYDVQDLCACYAHRCNDEIFNNQFRYNPDILKTLRHALHEVLSGPRSNFLDTYTYTAVNVNSTAVGANLCVWGPLEPKTKNRGTEGEGEKRACTVHTISNIFHTILQTIYVASCLIFCADNVFGYFVYASISFSPTSQCRGKSHIWS